MTVLYPFLQLYNVHKRFGRHVVLETLVLDVDQGEFLFLLGPSGCGKTTLLRLIAGLEPLTAGQILQAGRDVTRLPATERDFGIVFQSYALFPNLTVAENIAYGLQNRKQRRTQIAARVQELLQLVGLQGLDPRYPAQLSGGQQQRVALARALAPGPLAASARRTALCPGCSCARQLAGGDQTLAAPFGHHDDHGDPRPGRSVDHG